MLAKLLADTLHRAAEAQAAAASQGSQDGSQESQWPLEAQLLELAAQALAELCARSDDCKARLCLRIEHVGSAWAAC